MVKMLCNLQGYLLIYDCLNASTVKVLYWVYVTTYIKLQRDYSRVKLKVLKGTTTDHVSKCIASEVKVYAPKT